MSYMTPHAHFSPPSAQAGRLRSTGRRAAMLLLFLAHLIFSSALAFAQDPCDGTSTLTVNTGRDPMAGTLYPIGSIDEFWRITDDRTSGGFTLGDLPRCATVIERHPIWSLPGANSQWIASTPTHANTASYTITYEREFCIGFVPAQPEVYYDLWVLVDDQADIYIDGALIGSATSPNVATHLTGYAPVPMLTGVHTLKVVVDNGGYVSSGLNITGTLTIGVNGTPQPWFSPDGCCTRPCQGAPCLTDSLALGTNSSWTIIDDPQGGITPRCASEITSPPGNWGLATPGSTWIGTDANGSGMVNGIYTFQKYFEVSQATTLQLKLSVMADDGVDVELDGNPILSYPNWAGATPKKLNTLIQVEPGCHVFTFHVNNSDGIATGLDALIELIGVGLVKEECSTCPTCPDICETESYPLNTGYNPPLSSIYPIGAVDPYWHVVVDEAGGPVPRCANVINRAYSWDLPESNSQWIGTTPTADNPLNGRYIYERCFCIGDSGEVTIDIIVRGDDHAVIMLDWNTIGLNPPFGPTNPSHIVHTTTLRPGRHCLQIAVYNTGSIHAGLNVAGEVRGEGLLHFNCCDDMLDCSGDNLNMELSGVTGTDNGVAGTAMLRSIPNPTSGNTTIQYVVETESMVALDLYNTAGEKIASLLHERKKGGTYSLPYDARTLPAGIYYLRLTSGDKVTTVPMNVQ